MVSELSEIVGYPVGVRALLVSMGGTLHMLELGGVVRTSQVAQSEPQPILWENLEPIIPLELF